MVEIERMTAREYALRMKAASLRHIEKLDYLRSEILLSRAAQATDKKGKYVVKEAKQLINIEHMRKQLWSDKREEDEKEARFQDLKLRSELLRQYKKEKEAQTGGRNEERNSSIKSP